MACSVARPHTDPGCCESHFRNVEGCESGFHNASGTPPPTTEHRSVKASLRDPESLKEAFTDLAPDRTPLPFCSITALTTHERVAATAFA
ncbi:hypothetical protein B0293_09760 [Amycolatopsis azurea DSM 43854]|uniref:Uncharacterized protein n=1 Tax=Amycolatopsis azurea DSM 43854 TaxID=1238180 RepID=A0ABX3JHH2_9PSEU|nr:hypothetical protein B0293_09760 [Amycolatopsis azurea DSM 43854]